MQKKKKRKGKNEKIFFGPEIIPSKKVSINFLC